LRTCFVQYLPSEHEHTPLDGLIEVQLDYLKKAIASKTAREDPLAQSFAHALIVEGKLTTCPSTLLSADMKDQIQFLAIKPFEGISIIAQKQLIDILKKTIQFSEKELKILDKHPADFIVSLKRFEEISQALSQYEHTLQQDGLPIKQHLKTFKRVNNLYLEALDKEKKPAAKKIVFDSSVLNRLFPKGPASPQKIKELQDFKGSFSDIESAVKLYGKDYEIASLFKDYNKRKFSAANFRDYEFTEKQRKELYQVLLLQDMESLREDRASPSAQPKYTHFVGQLVTKHNTTEFALLKDAELSIILQTAFSLPNLREFSPTLFNLLIKSDDALKYKEFSPVASKELFVMLCATGHADLAQKLVTQRDVSVIQKDIDAFKLWMNPAPLESKLSKDLDSLLTLIHTTNAPNILLNHLLHSIKFG